MITWKDVLERSKAGNPKADRRVEKSAEDWQAQLTSEQYQVTRLKGTERPFSSEMCSIFEPGSYACVCCDTLLFDGDSKFESGSGWPSFTQTVADNVIDYIGDHTHGMSRIETVCSSCDAHLGHVFPDGPKPSGLRFCMNAVALVKRPQTEPSTG